MTGTDTIICIVKTWALKHHAIKHVWFYGSRAKEKEHVDSDVDIAIQFVAKYNDDAYWILNSHIFEKELQLLIPFKLDLQWYGGEVHTPTIHSALKEFSISIL